MLIASVPLTPEFIDTMVSSGVLDEKDSSNKDACGEALIRYIWHLHNELSGLILEHDAAVVMDDISRLLRYNIPVGSA